MKSGLCMTGLMMIIFGLGCCSKASDEPIQKRVQRMGFTGTIFKSTRYSASLPYQFYVPKTIDSRKYPLIVYLHGAGGRGTDNLKQMDTGVLFLADSINQKNYPAFILAPQCPENQQWLNTTFPKPPYTNYRQEDIPESTPMKVVIEIIENLLTQNDIDPDRVYVTGFSMGGSGTWDIITRHPQMFAAAAPVTGVSDPTKAYLLAHMSIWAFHGAKDNISLVTNTRNMIDSLKKYNNVWKYTEYPNGDHYVLDRAYREPGFLSWLYSQSRKNNL